MLKVAGPVVAGFAVLMALAPRIGPLRALVLGVRTPPMYVAGTLAPSQRVADVAAFVKAFESLRPDEYLVVRGNNGTGEPLVCLSRRVCLRMRDQALQPLNATIALAFPLLRCRQVRHHRHWVARHARLG